MKKKSALFLGMLVCIVTLVLQAGQLLTTEKPAKLTESSVQRQLHPTKISLDQETRVQLIDQLNRSLASAQDPYAQLKQAHWNVKGPQFIALHKLFDALATETLAQVDIMAERIAALGGTVQGTVQATVENTQLLAYPRTIFNAYEHLDNLTNSFAQFGKSARSTIKTSEHLGDMATGDLYIALTRFLDKSLWLLEAHLQGESADPVKNGGTVEAA